MPRSCTSRAWRSSKRQSRCDEEAQSGRWVEVPARPEEPPRPPASLLRLSTSLRRPWADRQCNGTPTPSHCPESRRARARSASVYRVLVRPATVHPRTVPQAAVPKDGGHSCVSPTLLTPVRPTRVAGGCDRPDRPRRSTHRQRRPEGARPAPRPGMTTCRRGCCPCPWPAPRRRAEGRVGGAKKARPHRAFRCSRNRRSPRPPLAGHPGRFTGRAATSHPSLPETRSYGDVLRRV